MKYIVVLGDGMADYKIDKLGGKTPLAYAKKKNIDFLARNGLVGIVKTIPENYPNGSDVANLSVMGYNPEIFYTGRSPIEAISMGIDMVNTDTAVRCNLVTLSDEPAYEDKTMLDYSAGEISTQDAKKLIEAIDKELGSDIYKFYAGVSYRHCMVWKHGRTGLSLTPPHDISNKPIRSFLPENKDLFEMMRKSEKILKNFNTKANSIWLWGEGTKLNIPNFYEKYKLRGSVISAVDLVKGLGIAAGMDIVNVDGATGTINTDFTAKMKACINELNNGKDFIYLHVEAPDECGHHFDIENKVRAIELIDEKIVGPMLDELNQFDDYSIMLLPDHPTPVLMGAHTSDPVPFVIYTKSGANPSGIDTYDEGAAKKSGVFIEKGYTLMDKFLLKQ